MNNSKNKLNSKIILIFHLYPNGGIVIYASRVSLARFIWSRRILASNVLIIITSL